MNEIMNERNIKSLNVGLAVVLLLSVVYSFIQVFYGMEYPDTFYFISRFTNSGYLDPFYLLNQVIFVLTNQLFGGYLISYKIVVWLFYALGMISCFCYGYNRTENKTLLYLGTIIGYLCLPNAAFAFAFNGNGMSILGVVLMLIALDSYTKGNKYALIWIGLLMAFLPLVRFPNIVTFVVVLLISLFICAKWKDNGLIILSLLCGVILYLLINCIVYGGLPEFANALKYKFAEASDTTAADHSMAYLIKEYLHSLKDGVSYYKLLFPLAIIPLLGFFTKKKIYAWILAIITVLGFIVVAKLIVTPDQWFFPWFASCLFMMLCIVICVFAAIRRDKQLFGWGLLPIGLGLCCCAGSDTGLTLFWGPICATAPFILIKIDKILKTTSKNELIWVMISFLGIAVCSFLYCRVDTMLLGVVGLILLLIFVYFISYKVTFSADKLVFDPSYAWIPINSTLATIILCSAFLLVFSHIRWQDWGDHPLYTYVYPVDEPKLAGIHTTYEQKIWIEDVMHEYRKLDDQQNVVFYGMVANIFPYLANIQSIQGIDFSWNENERNLQAFTMAMKTYPVVFLCPYNPGRPMYSIDDYPKIHEYLLGKGYTQTIHEHYAIYYPTNVDVE